MQTCIHHSEHVLYEMKVSGIVIAVCAACKDEIETRISTPPEILPETPIEHYAREGKMPELGCIYKLKGRNRYREISTYSCNSICDAGESICPRHIAQTKADAIAQEKEQARRRALLEEERKAKLRAGARR